MKLQFKRQEYQTRAVDAVVGCFKGQRNSEENSYRIDPGMEGQQHLDRGVGYGFKNGELNISSQQILENVREIQSRQGLPLSQHINLFKTLKKDTFVEDRVYTEKALKIAPYHFDIEMETGTGKTYCYIKTIFETNRQFGWNKFIIVVPSIAIREGVYKSLEITADHFQETYNKRAKFFTYNSKQLHNIESFSSDASINIMVINIQAFNAPGRENRRIYEELDNFQSRRPIDVIKANRPILILDEPQKMEGVRTLDSLKEFNPLFVLRYSATHKTQHNKVHRLDALDAYNQKLVKKIAVRGISVRGWTGTNAYLYLESIETSNRPPVARIEIEIKRSNQIKRTFRKLNRGDDLYTISGELDQYKGIVITDINANTDTVEFTNGRQLHAGEATQDPGETNLRRIQIREAIKAHLEKEQILYDQGIKVLTLFFIDEVAKYRLYTDAGEERGGEYAKMFEEEYRDATNQKTLETNEDYEKYRNETPVNQIHNGYFSIDKKSRRMVDPAMNATEMRRGEANDVDAYDLILKNKERLLSFEEPTRFIFSHSALREGWDNPNVFVICTLKHSDNTISRRQEVGRGLRISVNQRGERQDDPETVHDTNVLTIVASESYEKFVAALQKDISETLSERPRVANAEYFTGKTLRTPSGDIKVTRDMAEKIEFYLIWNRYVDHEKNIEQGYHDAVEDDGLADLPEELQPYREQVFQLIGSVHSDAQLPQVENDRGVKTNPLNANFKKKEFREFWDRINHKAVYNVYFDSEELIKKCVKALETELRVTPLQYTVQSGEQTEQIGYGQMQSGESFEAVKTSTRYNVDSVHSAVKYDLIGKVADNVQLTRRTVADILSGIKESVFARFKTNPESFISEVIRLIQEQKATVIVERLSYDVINEKYDINIFTKAQSKQDFSKAGDLLKKHIYDYAMTDSKGERDFVQKLDTGSEIEVYAKLPRGFAIPTPVGNYNPDWAIVFKEGTVKHIYFVAETKGSLSRMEFRETETAKVKCAHKFFDKINAKISPRNVEYGVVTSFGKLMEVVGVKATP